MNVNGINTKLLQGYIDQMDQTSPVGVPTAKIHLHWKNAMAMEVAGDVMEEAGDTFTRGQHKIRTDWPEPFSSDKGPTPGLELILTAVTACTATTFIAKAALQGIHVDELKVITEGQVDLKGVFEVDGAERPAMENVKITLHVRSDADDQTINDLIERTKRTSPVIGTFMSPVPVDVALERLG